MCLFSCLTLVTVMYARYLLGKHTSVFLICRKECNHVRMLPSLVTEYQGKTTKKKELRIISHIAAQRNDVMAKVICAISSRRIAIMSLYICCIYTNTHISCAVGLNCVFQKSVLPHWRGKKCERNRHVYFPFPFLWFVVFWHSNLQVPCSIVNVDSLCRHFCSFRFVS